jgi:DME family drug/metabolite transporter
VAESQSSLIAILPALIWAIVPLIYKEFLVKNSAVKINFYRMLYASLALSIPFILFGYNEGIIFGILSGILTLSIGDSFYLLAIRKIGASIAAPIAYTYVFFSQFAALSLGEKISLNYFISSILIIIGVFLLSKAEKSEVRFLGILIALSASLFWTLGQSMIKLATIQNMNSLSIAFARTSAACIILGIASYINERRLSLNVGVKKNLILAIASISDLAIGSSLFILSIALAGLGITIIVTSLSPLITQLIAKMSGKENPRAKDIFGGLLIVAGVLISLI